jgi:SDR family mycofactocin-dependent oxidoreductase
MGRMEGKVAFVTGAARGQGRSHSVRLAQDGADIIAVDICRKFEASPAAGATPEDLDITAGMVKDAGGRVVTAEVDVRDDDALRDAVDGGVEQLGRLDVIVANAGIGTTAGKLHKTDEALWQEMIDVNLSGVWKTVKAGVPHILRGDRGGSIVLTSSVAGNKAYPHVGHYVAAKHGVIGLMRSFAVELGQRMIRVNAVLPTHVNSPLLRTTPPTVLFGPNWRTRSRRSRPGMSELSRPADPVGHSRRHQQRRAIPGIRRGALYHRCGPAHGRRQLPEVRKRR